MTQSPMQPGPVYLDTQLALSQIGDEETMNSMLRMLQESLARDVPRISALMDAGDVAAASRLLHGLKGFIPIFCNSQLCDHVVRVELLSKSGPSAEVGPAYRGLRPELEQLLAEVGVYLTAHPV